MGTAAKLQPDDVAQDFSFITIGSEIGLLIAS